MTNFYFKKVLATRQTCLYRSGCSTEQPLLNLTGSELMEYATAEAYNKIDPKHLVALRAQHA